MHRVVFSSIDDPPPKIRVYLGLLTVILGFLKSIAYCSENKGLFKVINRYFTVAEIGLGLRKIPLC